MVRRHPGNSRGEWPVGLVPAFYCGCTMFELVDCHSPEGPVLCFDEDTEDLSQLFTRMPVSSLAVRLEAWLDGKQPW